MKRWWTLDVMVGISVVLVDDSQDVRDVVRRRLESSGLFEVVGEGSDGAEEHFAFQPRNEARLPDWRTQPVWRLPSF